MTSPTSRAIQVPATVTQGKVFTEEFLQYKRAKCQQLELEAAPLSASPPEHAAGPLQAHALRSVSVPDHLEGRVDPPTNPQSSLRGTRHSASTALPPVKIPGGDIPLESSTRSPTRQDAQQAQVCGTQNVDHLTSSIGGAGGRSLVVGLSGYASGEGRLCWRREATSGVRRLVGSPRALEVLVETCTWPVCCLSNIV